MKLRTRLASAETRPLALALVSCVVLACGGPTTSGAVSAAPVADREVPLSWSLGPFALSLPDGVQLAMDAEGRLLRNGAPVGRMHPDGRVEDVTGAPIATLLGDGQVSHRRALYPARLVELPSILGGSRQIVLRASHVDLMVLEGSTLRIAEHGAWPRGEAQLSPGAAAGTGPIALLVALLELLEHPRAVGVQLVRAGAQLSPIPAPPDVLAPPAHATRTASGLAYVVLTPGRGTRHPGPRARVRVHYTGWTTDGVMFDSSVARGEAPTLPLHAVIPGWTEGVQLMVEGQRSRFWMPPALGYGDHPRPGVPSGMLVFDVELLEIVEP